MAYEKKPGDFALFKNDRKENERQPDYRGDGVDCDGNEVWISAWLKDGNKGKFMSCRMERKQPKPAGRPPVADDDFMDDIPFN
jgi:hypothetical protein